MQGDSKMKKITVTGNQRKDGKFPVTYWYEGEPNMFGGRYPAKVFKKLHTVEQIADHKLYDGDMFVNMSNLSNEYFGFGE